jgi:hypothetical protein
MIDHLAKMRRSDNEKGGISSSETPPDLAVGTTGFEPATP